MEIVVPHPSTGSHHHDPHGVYHEDSDVEIFDEDDIIEEEVIEEYDEEVLSEVDHNEMIEDLVDEVDYDDDFDEEEVVVEEEIYEEEIIDEEEVILDDSEDIVEEIIEEIGTSSPSPLPSSRKSHEGGDYETKHVASLKGNDKVSFVNFHKNEKQKPPPQKQQQQEPSEAKKDVERWINRNDKEPDDLKTACEVLLEVLYENNSSGDEDDAIDTDTMMRRTPLRELYRYLKQQYWYKVHNGQLSPDALSKVVATPSTSSSQQQTRQKQSLEVQISGGLPQSSSLQSPRHLDQFFSSRQKSASSKTIERIVEDNSSRVAEKQTIPTKQNASDTGMAGGQSRTIQASSAALSSTVAKNDEVGKGISAYQFLIPVIAAVIAGCVFFVSSTKGD